MYDMGYEYITYTVDHTKFNTKKKQRYHSEFFLADNTVYKHQTIKITDSCDVWMMTKSVFRVATIVVYNHCHMPRSRRLWMNPSGTAVSIRFLHIAKVDLV
ncbi:uncharacterized protein TNCV_2717431 [Trichonephila clavipes]|nr:uncharacterized protein TNCV_2717431 [Trichonephila clavipes]